MKIGMLTRGGIDHGSSRVRALQFIPHLESGGNQVRVLRREPRTAVRSRIRYFADLARLARWADVLFLQKPNYDPRLVDFLAAANGRLVVDVDDAVWRSPRAATDPAALAVGERFAERLRYAVGRAGRAVAGSRHLARWLAEQCPAAEVSVIPPCVDLHDSLPAKAHRASGEPAVVGWIGSSGNLGDLDLVLRPLRRLVEQRRVTFRVICDRPPGNDLPCEFVRWTLGGEVSSLLACDIGIMPLGREERAQGRCGYKALQYMALGIPVVASNEGAAGDIVEEGRTGFLVSDDEGWADCLANLAADPGLRSAMGAAARERVGERFSIQSNLQQLLRVLAAARGRRGARPA